VISPKPALTVLLGLAMLAGCGPPGAPEGPPATPAGSATGSPLPEGKSRLRTVGPADRGGVVTVRVGDRLDVAPAGPGGWRIVSYPTQLLRLDGDPGPADRHAFVAFAIGDGQVSLAGSGGAEFAVRVRVLRDLVQEPSP
jgi:hypothetical protein